MIKKILLGLLAIVLIAGIWAAFNQEKATQMIVDLGMSLTSSVKHRDLASEKAKFEVGAVAFAQEFKTNATEANAKYINQAVLVDGEVTAVSGNTISINNVACNMDSTQLSKMSSIQPGAKIKVQGLVVGYNDLMEEIALAQCSIKE